MQSLKNLISIEQEIYRARPFSKELMNVTFIEKVKEAYPLVYIDESMFKIEIKYYTTPFVIEKHRVCEISLTEDFLSILEEYYPEAMI